jgi:hypothetical protein
MGSVSKSLERRVVQLERKHRRVASYYEKLSDDELRAEYERIQVDDQRVAALLGLKGGPICKT